MLYINKPCICIIIFHSIPYFEHYTFNNVYLNLDRNQYIYVNRLLYRFK